MVAKSHKWSKKKHERPQEITESNFARNSTFPKKEKWSNLTTMTKRILKVLGYTGANLDSKWIGWVNNILKSYKSMNI